MKNDTTRPLQIREASTNDVLSEILCDGAHQMLGKAIEAEVTDYIAEQYYARAKAALNNANWVGYTSKFSQHDTPEEKRKAFDYYEGLTVRDSSLSASVQAVVAAEVGHMELAYDYLAEAALMDLHDLEHNVLDGLHIASLGGALTAVTAGLGGMRHYGSELSFAPRLPPGLDRLAFPVLIRGRRLRVEVGRDEAVYELSGDGPGVQITHWGETVELEPGVGVSRPIPAAPEQPTPSQPRGRAPARRGDAS